ncbi:vesicle-associated membrane protein 5-like [Sinocyclocheilus anshuiensis]|uniref:Vesicle-associated membrane protein 5-like n=1 Tax=Sinocyclocheilus anshuiensis TaxID=1608454 RepID=A0A671KJZ8_9TELE|nr:PREDICTED: vesicle-associated membrane protein 5-like [Sinocyclocheilus anshuiensis]
MENGQSSLRQAQQDVEDIKVIMLDNINKADERAGKLGELEDRADKLLVKSEQFSKTSTKVKQKKRWENIKYKVIIAAVVAAVLLGIIVAVAVSLSREDSKNTPEDTSAQAPGDG